MARLTSQSDKAHTSIAACRAELLQVQKNLATALKKLKVCSVQAVTMTKKQDAVSTKYDELPWSVKQSVGFSNN